jgi:hypothetical protein
MIAVIAVAGKQWGKKTELEEDRRKGIEITFWGRRRKGLIYNLTWAAGNQFLNAADTITENRLQYREYLPGFDDDGACDFEDEPYYYNDSEEGAA